MIKAVIFDMDGVLIDSQPIHYKGDIEVLKYYGVEVDLEAVKPYTGMSNPDRWPKYKEAYRLPQTVDEIINTQVRVIMELFEKEDLQPVDGLMKLLEMLKAHRIKMAVASSSSLDLIRLVLKKIRAEAYFDEIISGEEVAVGKPAPDIFIRAAEKLQTTKEECIVIEDSSNGVNAACNAGIKCVAYINPTTGPQDLSRADVAIDSFHKINQDASWLE